MCGIAGFVDHNYYHDREFLLNSMLTSIQHRGPDETGLYLGDKACIGNVRLSIVDLAHGQQPLCNTEGYLWIAYNGEVFNYPELKALLEQKGYVFKTNSDTEVVLLMYQEFGKDCLNYFNGQFAFAIWNEKESSLFIARDRMGIRPLYYSDSQGRLVFASEMKSLFQYPDVKRELSYKGLVQVYRFWNALSPQTSFEGVFELPAGHYAEYKNGKLKIERYWTLNYAKKVDRLTNVNEIKETFHALLKDSVALRLRADVPVAAYLSGGLDSTSTTALIKQLFPDVLNTYSIGFADAAFDETHFQKEVAAYFQTNHQSMVFNNSDLPSLLEKVLWHSEIPLLRTGPFPMFRLSEMVRQSGIKVVITGEGADEMLGGYNIFKETLIRLFWSKFPESKLRPLLLKKLYPYIPQIKNGSPGALRMFFGYQLKNTDSPVYSHLLRWKNSQKLINHLSPSLKAHINGYDPVSEYASSIEQSVSGLSGVSKAQYIESTLFLPGYLLSSQGDRMAMANSVEGRYPFLDYRLIEFCTQLPDDLKLKGLNEKYLLKSIVKDQIPDSVLNRSKQAYRAPIASALVNDKSGFVEHMLSSSEISKIGIFDSVSVSKIFTSAKNFNGQISEIDNMALMAILSTQIINKLFISDFKRILPGEEKKGVVMNKEYSKI